jgi:type IV pilus assembly protein PilB
MAGSALISTRVAERLGAAGLLTNEQLAWALAQADATGKSAGEIVLERQFVTEEDIARVLEEWMGVPRVELASYAPDDGALALVPEDIARSAGIVPMFEIDGVLTVAIGRASDVFELDDLAAKIGLEVEAVLADSDAVSVALSQCYGPAPQAAGDARQAESAADEPVAASIPESVSASDGGATSSVEPGPIASDTVDFAPLQGYARGTIDLDVLAVADGLRTSLLVTEIMEAAVARRASGIHILPYKDDFFLALRVDGRLEQLGHAPLSMQGALVDGLGSFLRMPPVAEGPSVSRLQLEVSGVPAVVTASLVRTLAGQRLVVEIGYDVPVAYALDELGLSKPEVKAISALTERGGGLVVVASPVGEGRGDTYHAMLAHAAVAGRTVYSVERGTGPRVPAVAQVPVLSSSSPGTAAYIAAGLGQDTDVLGVESLCSAEEAHLALEAADAGRLVIVGVVAAGTTAALRRLLDLGVEPVSLASGVALVIGQRMARSASGGRTTVYEVLPVTDGVRAAIAASASANKLESAAREAGMRPFSASGVAKAANSAVAGSEEPEEIARLARAAQ